MLHLVATIPGVQSTVQPSNEALGEFTLWSRCIATVRRLRYSPTVVLLWLNLHIILNILHTMLVRCVLVWLNLANNVFQPSYAQLFIGKMKKVRRNNGVHASANLNPQNPVNVCHWCQLWIQCKTTEHGIRVYSALPLPC